MKSLFCAYLIVSLLIGSAFHSDLYNKQMRECGRVDKDIFSSQEILATTIVWPVLSLIGLTVVDKTHDTCGFLEDDR